jgi:NAD(P)-dependent dehydrogenase (short-subunit alcohol dehydrogenase family)
MMRNGGSIIMNGSIAHLKGMPGLGVYAGSKAALRSFARSWAVELAARRIRVNVLSPGPIATNALANAPAEAKEQFLSAIPRKEFGRSEEIATTALFLASDDSSFVNGSEICVDGGLAQI